jgi:hypothetical protein
MIEVMAPGRGSCDIVRPPSRFGKIPTAIPSCRRNFYILAIYRRNVKKIVATL